MSGKKYIWIICWICLESKGKAECDIEYWTDKYFDDLLENTIIIGDSLQHGFIVMICAGVSETDKIESHGLCNREKAKCYLPAFFLLLC